MQFDEPVRRVLAGEVAPDALPRIFCPVSGGEYFCIVIRGGDGDWAIVGDTEAHVFQGPRGTFAHKERYYNLRFYRRHESPRDARIQDYSMDFIARLLELCEVIWFGGPGFPVRKGLIGRQAFVTERHVVVEQ